MPSEPFLGEIYMSGFNFAPSGYALCQGQIISIAQNTALFALLGTTFGGNGTTTFALPDLRGRVPLGWGNGNGLTPNDLGQTGGVENVTLITSQIPAHTHTLVAMSDLGDTSDPTNAFHANTATLDKDYKSSAGTAVALNPASIGLTGGNQPHYNMQPYLVLNFYIALQGIFPSRS